VQTDQPFKFIATLTEHDLAIVEKEVEFLLKKFPNNKALGRTQQMNQRIGAMCEITVAKFLQVPFVPEYEGRTEEMGDVCGYQVKGTDYFDGGMNTRDDMPAGIYIGAFVTWPNIVTLQGWSTSRMMRREIYWDDTRTKPCYYLPPDQMWDLEMMPATRQLVEQRKQIA
jgi:hypothetical protein